MANHTIKTNIHGIKFCERKGSEVSAENHGCGARVYRSSPHHVALQIRATTPLTSDTSRGSRLTPRKLFAHLELNAAQVDELIDALLAESSKLSRDLDGASDQLQAQAALSGKL